MLFLIVHVNKFNSQLEDSLFNLVELIKLLVDFKLFASL